MLSVLLDKIKDQNNEDAVTGVCILLMNDIKNCYETQQKKINKIRKIDYPKIEKERLKKKKVPEEALIFFNSVYTGSTNKKKLPDGKGTLVFASRDKDYPEENDIYIGEFENGTKTGIGQYTYWNDRNIAKHPTLIPYYMGEWSGDQYYGVGIKIIDSFDDRASYEGEFANNTIFGFGKYHMNNQNGSTDIYGYFIDGQASYYGVEIHKDNNGKIIKERSGLTEYNLEKKTRTLLFSFPWEDTWNEKILNTKNYKRKEIIQEIYNAIIDKNIYQIDLMTNKFKKSKLLIKKKHMELMFSANSFWDKNHENDEYTDFINTQSELMHKLNSSFKNSELDNFKEEIDESTKIFTSIKKKLNK